MYVCAYIYIYMFKNINKVLTQQICFYSLPKGKHQIRQCEFTSSARCWLKRPPRVNVSV